MATPTTPRLDNLAAMQSRPLGTNTALYRDPSTEALTRQYRQQKSDYGLARRLLKREARRGGLRAPDAALGMIKLGEQAQEKGVQFGMEGRDQIGAAVAGQRADMATSTAANNLAAGRMRGTSPTAPASAPASPIPMAGPPTAGADILPSTDLGVRADQVRRERGGSDTSFRQGLDRAIGMAKTPEEMNDLQRIALKSNISPDQFKSRQEWWNKKRK